MRHSALAAVHAGTTGIASTTGAELLFGGPHTEVRLVLELAAVARDLWPRKTAAELACRAEVTTRAAEKWLSKDAGGISGEQLARLQRSDHGLRFVHATVGPNYRLWTDLRDEYEALFLREQIDNLKRRLRE